MDIEDAWSNVASGESDVMTSAWLPETHQPYLQRYRDDVKVLDPLLTGTRLGLMVPTGSTGRQTGETGRNVPLDIPVESIADLPEYAAEFGGQIIGIESGAGVTLQTRQAIETYGLDEYQLVEGSEQEMTRRIAQALRNEQWIVFTGWTPHWITSRWSVRFLEDPQGVFADEGSIHLVVRPDFETEFPDVATFLRRFELNPHQLSQLMNWNQRYNASPYGNAKRWIETHPDVMRSWLDRSE